MVIRRQRTRNTCLLFVLVLMLSLVALLLLQPWWPARGAGPLGPIQLPDPARFPLQRELAGLAVYQVPAAQVRPDGRPLLVLLHGTSLHSQWLAPLMHQLAQQGWPVRAIDLPGHGHSPGRRGHLASDAQIESQLAAVLEALQKTAAPRSLVLLGHSLGAEFLLRPGWLAQLQARGVALGGVAVLAPYIGGGGNERSLSWGQTMWSLAPLGLLDERRPALAANWSLQGRDPLLIEHYHRSLLRLQRSRTEAAARLAGLRLPLLYLQGQEDELFDPVATHTLFAQIGSRDKTLLLLPATGHMNLIERAATPLLHWLTQRFDDPLHSGDKPDAQAFL